MGISVDPFVVSIALHIDHISLLEKLTILRTLTMRSV